MTQKIYSIERRKVGDFTVWRARYMVAAIGFGVIVSGLMLLLSVITTGVISAVFGVATVVSVIATVGGGIFVGIHLDENRYDHVFWLQRWWFALRGWTLFDDFRSSGRDDHIVKAISYYECIRDSHTEFPEIDTLTRLFVTQGGLYERYVSLQTECDKFYAISDGGRNAVAQESIKRILEDQKSILSAMRDVDVAADKIRDKERAERVAIETTMAELGTKLYTSDVDQLTEDARREAEIAKHYITSRDS